MKFWWLVICSLLLVSCDSSPAPESSKQIPPVDSSSHLTIVETIPEKPLIDSFSLRLDSAGLVNISSLDSNIIVSLAYSSTQNFMETDVYADFEACYLQKPVAQLLVKAQHLLKQKHPHYNLVCLDCVRPKRVQQQMWDLVKGTPKARYVARPMGFGSLHNIGVAVDVTIADSSGQLLDMGTAFDCFDSIAQPRYEMYFYKKGALTWQQLENRWLLKTTMKQAGFRSILTEWWHYNGMQKSVARAKYKVVE